MQCGREDVYQVVLIPVVTRSPSADSTLGLLSWYIDIPVGGGGIWAVYQRCNGLRWGSCTSLNIPKGKTGLHSTALALAHYRWSTAHCTALHCTALHFNAPPYTSPHCTALQWHNTQAHALQNTNFPGPWTSLHYRGLQRNSKPTL